MIRDDAGGTLAGEGPIRLRSGQVRATLRRASLDRICYFRVFTVDVMEGNCRKIAQSLFPQQLTDTLLFPPAYLMHGMELVFDRRV